jgi:hypothetical protein
MERREFLTKSCAATVAAVSGGALLAQEQAALPRNPGESDIAYRTRLAQFLRVQQQALRAQQQAQQAAQGGAGQYYELRRYEIETEAQKAGFDDFAREAAIPALNRLGIKPVGVFYPNEGLSPIYVLLPHPSLGSFVTLAQRLGEDPEFMEKGSDFVNAPATAPAYKSLEVQLMAAFEGMPQLQTPTEAPTRIFQLRTYESPSEKAGFKKIEMFNTAEIGIFRKVGLHPVFFGQTLAGTKMPNLTYMLGFADMAESKANWKKFGADPDWQRLRAIPEYMDKEIIRKGGITNLYLKPARYSQI